MLSKKRNIILFCIVVTLLSVARFLFLEQDAPAYMIGGICQEDEAYYALGGISRYNADHNLDVKGIDYSWADGLVLYSTHLTYLSMSLLGNNYLGLRLPVVIISLLSIIIMGLVTKSGNNKYISVSLWLCFATDFYFYLFSRFQNPQVYSMFSITLLLWILFNFNYHKKIVLIAIGFFAVFAVTFVYIYNAFLLLGVSGFICILAFKNKSVKYLIYYSLGCILSLLCYIISVKLVGGDFEKMFGAVLMHGGGMTIETGEKVTQSFSFLSNIKNGLLGIFTTNFFRYNLVLLVMFFSLFPLFIKAVFRKNEKAIVLTCVLVAFIIQVFFVMSHPFKKHIVLLPLLILYLIISLNEFLSSSPFKRREIFFIFGGLTIGILICYFNYKTNNSELYWGGFNYGYFEKTPVFINVLNWSNVFIWGALLLLWIFNKFQHFFIKTLVCILPLCGIVLSLYYCFYLKRFEIKEALSDIGKNYRNEIFVERMVHAHQFYSNIKPGLNPYFFKADTTLYIKQADSLYKNVSNPFILVKYFNNDTLYAKLNREDVFIYKDRYATVEKIYKLKYYNYLVARINK